MGVVTRPSECTAHVLHGNCLHNGLAFHRGHNAVVSALYISLARFRFRARGPQTLQRVLAYLQPAIVFESALVLATL